MPTEPKSGEQYRVRETLEVAIEKIVPGGAGLAFAENLTVFVPLSVPGDRLCVQIQQLKGKTAFAEIEKIIEPSPLRVEPPCPYFGACGGCNFQQLDYASQLEAKTAIIRDCLRRIGKIEYAGDIPIIGSPKDFEYRLRAQWHLDTRERTIGYYRRNTHEVIDIARCPKLLPPLNAELENLRGSLRWENLWSPRVEVEAASGEDGQVSRYSAEILEPTKEVSITACGEEYTFSAQSFFQGNRYMIEALVDAAVKNTVGRTALDLYCGVGLFSLPLARRFEKVIGIESNDLAIEFAEKNAAKAGLANIQFISDGVERFIKEGQFGGVDLVLLDPPRAGTSKETILRILGLRPKAITYVSCEPSIFARDLRWMLDRGYAIESITGLDLFPQTHHVETVVRLHRSEPPA